MSALEFLIDEAARHGIPKDRIEEARAELELLRNMAEEFCVLLKDRIIQGPDSWEDWVDTYLYIDPERARGRWG